MLQRGCADSFLGEAVEYVETETIPDFMGQAKDTQDEDDGLKLMQRHCKNGKGTVSQIPQKMKRPSQGQEENRICSVT